MPPDLLERRQGADAALPLGVECAPRRSNPTPSQAPTRHPLTARPKLPSLRAQRPLIPWHCPRRAAEHPKETDILKAFPQLKCVAVGATAAPAAGKVASAAGGAASSGADGGKGGADAKKKKAAAAAAAAAAAGGAPPAKAKKSKSAAAAEETAVDDDAADDAEPDVSETPTCAQVASEDASMAEADAVAEAAAEPEPLEFEARRELTAEERHARAEAVAARAAATAVAQAEEAAKEEAAAAALVKQAIAAGEISGLTADEFDLLRGAATAAA